MSTIVLAVFAKRRMPNTVTAAIDCSKLMLAAPKDLPEDSPSRVVGEGAEESIELAASDEGRLPER